MHVLLVGAWPELANQLVGLPARVSLLQLPGAGGGREAQWAHRYLEVDYADADTAVTAAEAVHRDDPVDVVVGFREFALPAVAAIARRLGIACVPGPVGSLGRDKAEVRELLNAAGCRTVRYRRCASSADVAELAASAGYPVIVKPAVGAGSMGVCAVECPEDVEAAWAHAGTVAGPILAEELLTGPEYSVEVRSVDGCHEPVAVTEKLTTGRPHFVESGHLVPARVAPATSAALAAEAVRALDAIGHRTGPSHVELILTPAGPTVVEVNRRLGGDRIWELVALATGRNMMLESLLDAVGIGPQPRSDLLPSRAAAIRFLLPPYEGRVAQPSVAAVTAFPDVIRAHLSVAEGASVAPARSSLDRLGYVLAVAADAEQAAKAAELAQEAIARDIVAPAGGDAA